MRSSGKELEKRPSDLIFYLGKGKGMGILWQQKDFREGFIGIGQVDGKPNIYPRFEAAETVITFVFGRGDVG